jgi:hypothetical protein
MREYEALRTHILEARLMTYTPKFGSNRCEAGCQNLLAPSSSLFRCRDCHGGQLLCQTCCATAHLHNPFHRLERWDRSHFFPSTPREAGITIYLGHGGHKCPSLSPMHLPTSLFFGDITGFFSLPVHWCICPGQPYPEQWKQLVSMGYMPASWSSPKTAFTKCLLEWLHLLQMECHAALRQLYTFLERITDQDNIIDINVSFCLLLVHCSNRCLEPLSGTHANVAMSS